MNAKLAAIFLGLALTLSARADIFQPSWTWLGPAPIPNGQTTTTSTSVSGRVTTIVVHPTNASIAYVGTAQGGVYRTTDGGSSWTAIFDDAGVLAIGALKLAPSDPTTLFVGTGEAYNNSDARAGLGLYVITNAETTPSVAGPFNKNSANANVFEGNSISQILVSATDANTILVSTSSGLVGRGSQLNGNVAARGIFRSTNALSASPTFTLLTVDVRVFDMAADPTNLNNVVMVTGTAIYRMTNAISGSLAITAMFTPTNPFSLVRFALNKVGTTTTLLAVTSEAQSGFPPNGTGTKQGTLRRATYNGSTWSAWSAPLAAANGFADPQAFYDMGVAIDPTNASNIYIGGTASDFYGSQSGSFKKSSDAGATFTASENGLHSDTHAIAVAPSNPAIIYFGSDGGIWKSTDTGASWTSLSNSTFSATQFQNLAIHPTDRNFMLVGAQDNGTEFLSSNGTWSQAAGGDGGACLIDQNATDTTNVVMYHTFYNLRAQQIGFEERDTTSGTWVFRGYVQTGTDAMGNPIYTSNNGINGANAVNFYAPMARGPGNPNTVYFGTDRLYRSTNKGAAMTIVSQSPLDPTPTDTSVGSPISSISISPQNDAVRLIGLDSGKVFATSNGSSSLTNVSGSIPATYIGQVLIDPSNVNTAYVALAATGLTSGQQIWKTTNLGSGATWSASGTGIPDIAVNTLAIDPTDSNRVYAGTDDGVYASSDGGAHWARFGTNLPHVAVWELAFQNQNRYLRAATHGRGVYEALPDAPHNPPDVTITSPAHNSSIASFTNIAGTALDHSGTGLAGNSVNFTLYHVNTSQYWTGSGWSNTATQFGVTVDPNSHIWTYSGGLPNAGNGTLRTGQYAMSAFTRDNNNDNSTPLSGVNNILFNVDIAPPSVAIISPPNQSLITSQAYGFSGTANDDQAINRVILFVRKNSDNSYWNGSGYVVDPLQANLNSTYNSSDHSWTCNTTLPIPGFSMPNGSYTFYAIAEDKAGNQTQTQSDVTVEIVFKWTGATLRDGDPNNDSTSWNTAANWSTNSVPGTGDIVQMDNGDTIDLGVDRTVRGLRLGGSTTFDNHKITVTGGPGTSVWSGGSVQSNLVVAPGAAMTIDTTGGPYLGGTLTNAGTITVIASDPNNQQQMLGHNSNVINQSGGRIEIARDGRCMLNIGVPPIITNQPGGVIVKTNVASGHGLINWALDNNGTAGSDSGTLAFDQGSTAAGSSGTFNASTASARVELAGGTHTLQAGARFTGPGRGSLTSGTLTLAGAATVGTGGQAAGGFEMSGGNMDGAGSLSMIGGGGSFVWSSGTIFTSVNLGAGTTSTFDTTGQPNLNSGAVLSNAGTITVIASDPNNQQQILGHNSNVVNQSGGRIQIARDGRSFLNIGVPPIITNQAGGVIVKTNAANGRGIVNWVLDNNGTVGSDSGALAFDQGSTALGSAGAFNMSTAPARVEFAGGSHILKAGARFTGPGRGSLTAGTLSLAGAATIGAAGSPAGGFEMSGGNMDGAGSLSMIGGGGSFVWSSGTIFTAVNLGAGTTSTFDTTSQPNLNSGAVLSNAGTITVIASNPNDQQQILGHNSNLINQSGGRIEIARDGVLMLNIGIVPIITNQPGGVIVKTNSGAGRSVIDWVLDNNGTVGSNTGTLAFDQGSTAAGSGGVFNMATSPARVEFANGNHILNAGARFTGPGRGSLTAGTLTLAGAANVGAVGAPAGGFEMSGGSMNGAGSLSMIGGGGSFVWSSGSILTSVNLGAGTTSTFDTTGQPNLNSGAVLTNAGTITVLASNPNDPQQILGHNSNLINQSGGRIQIARDGRSFLNIGTVPIITNQAGGMIVKTGAASGRGIINWVLDNNGTVESDIGTLAFDQGSTGAGSAGVFNMSTAATRVEFANGGHILKSGARFTGPGRGQLTAGTLSLAGAATIGAAGLPAGGFEMSGGSMDGAGSLSMIGGAGSFVWSGGSILTSVSFGAGTTSTFDTTGQPNLYSGATLDNSGTITISASDPNNQGQMLGHNSNLVNEPGGRIEIARDGTLMVNIGAVPVVTNYGVIAKINGLTSDFGSFALVERGTLSLVPNSVLHLGGSVTFDFPSQIMGGKVLFDTTPPTMQAPVTISAGSILELNGGGMNGAVDGNGNPLATINGPGTLSWKAGAIAGKLNLGPLLNWQIDTTGNPGLSNATINHAGTALVSGTGYLSNVSSTLNIAAGALFQINVSMTLQNFGGAPLIVNAGTFKIGGPAAAVTSNWDFTQTSTGKLDFEIGGTGAGTPPQYSRFAVGGTALLGGTLSATQANGFVPAEGTSFPVMTFGNRSGTDFASTAGLNIAIGTKLVPALTATTLNLNAVLTSYGDWRKAKFGADADNPLIAGPNADPDHDGIPNALEHAFNLDPLSANRAGLPTVSKLDDPTTHKKHLGISYRRRIGVTDDIYTVRVSNDLGAWDESGSQLEQVGSPVPTGDGVTEMVTVRVATPIDAANKKFLDVMVQVQ